MAIVYGTALHLEVSARDESAPARTRSGPARGDRASTQARRACLIADSSTVCRRTVRKAAVGEFEGTTCLAHDAAHLGGGERAVKVHTVEDRAAPQECERATTPRAARRDTASVHDERRRI